MTRKTHLRILIPVLSLLIFIGCAAKKSLWGDPNSGFILKYRIQPGQQMTYHSVTAEFTTLEMMGQSMETETKRDMTYSIHMSGYDEEENLTTEVSIDSLYWKSQSMQGDQEIDTDPVVGSKFGLIISPIGKELEFKDMEALPKIDMGQMAGQFEIKSLFQSLFPDLPPNLVKVGDTWKDDEESTDTRNNIDIKTITESTSTLEGFETIGNTECLKIKTQTVGIMDGAGNMMGSDMSFEGDMEGSTTWYFDYKNGMFIKAVSDVVVEATIAVSGQANMTIPMVTESKVEVSLIR